jgi:hypothetical protein
VEELRVLPASAQLPGHLQSWSYLREYPGYAASQTDMSAVTRDDSVVSSSSSCYPLVWFQCNPFYTMVPSGSAGHMKRKNFQSVLPQVHGSLNIQWPRFYLRLGDAVSQICRRTLPQLSGVRPAFGANHPFIVTQKVVSGNSDSASAG